MVFGHTVGRGNLDIGNWTVQKARYSEKC